MYKMEDWEWPHCQIWLKNLKNVNAISVDLKHSILEILQDLQVPQNQISYQYVVCTSITVQENNMFEITYIFIVFNFIIQ